MSIWDQIASRASALRPALERLADDAVRIVDPKRAALREHHRKMRTDGDYRGVVEAVLRASGYRRRDVGAGRAYKAADLSDDKAGPWRSSPASPDSDVLPARELAMLRARELVQNNPIASGLVKTFTNAVVGTGGRAQAATKDATKNERIDAVWTEICHKLHPTDGWQDWPAAQRGLYARAFVDGDFLTVYSRPDEQGLPVFQTIEADRLRTPPGERPVDEDGSIRDGVEKDSIGRVVAYHIADRYPVETLWKSTAQPTSMTFERVEAWRVHHRAYKDRPGQSRGMTQFSAVEQDLQDLDLLIVASLKRIQVSACLSVFLKSTSNPTDFLSVTAGDYGFELDQQLEPGMIFRLWPGEEAQTLAPNFPNTEFLPFIILLARRIGAHFGVSWQIVLKDFSQSNYSSARADILVADETWRGERASLCEGRGLLVWTRLAALQDARLRGDPRLADCSDADLAAVRWIFDGRRWVDPQKEGAGAVLKKDVGLFTLQAEAAAIEGQDWRDLQDQQVLEEDRLRTERQKRMKARIVAAIETAKKIKEETGAEVSWELLVDLSSPQGADVMALAALGQSAPAEAAPDTELRSYRRAA